MESVLNDMDYIALKDPEGMLSEITEFPKSAKISIEKVKKVDLKNISDKKYDNMIIVGMGGSAVGGILLSDWLLDNSSTQIVVSRGYHLPRWVTEKTLVYVVSYSGNTEETLSQYHEAIKLGCDIICFCSGGKLKQLAEENAHPVVIFPSGRQPRASIPFQFYSLASITYRLGIINDTVWAEIDDSIDIVTTLCQKMEPSILVEKNPGKTLAESIKGYIPFIYGPRLFQGVAYRYSTQFNENSKSPAATNFFPEAFHNSIMAREGDRKILKQTCAVVIVDPFCDDRLARKISKNTELMAKGFGRIVEVEACGESSLARMMSALIIGDYASAYLGILYGVDPSTTESIRILKASMEDTS